MRSPHLRRLLLWCQQNGYAPEPNTVFNLETWKGMGDRLWDAVSNRDKETRSSATAWKLVYVTLQDTKAERAAAFI